MCTHCGMRPFNNSTYSQTLPLPTSGGYALDERFLREEEEDENRKHNEGGGRHQIMPRRATLLTLKALQS